MVILILTFLWRGSFLAMWALTGRCFRNTQASYLGIGPTRHAPPTPPRGAI